MRSYVYGMSAAIALSAGGALADPVGNGLTHVPPEALLTYGAVFANAAPVVQIVFLILLTSVVLALVIWTMNISRTDNAIRVGTALGRLRIIRSAATPLGCLAASYTLFSSFMGMANVRPAPSISILAPGWAEAALAVMLGLLATTIAVTCERHLEARVRRATA